MQLEVNPDHKSMEKTSLETKRRIKAAIAGATIFVALYSGIIVPPAYAADDIPQTAQEQTIEEVNIPEFLVSTISSKVGKQPGQPITKEDLQKIEYIYVGYLEEGDMSFLQYCTNLETLLINVRDQKDDLSFLKWAPNLKSLDLTFMTEDLDVLETIPVMDTVESIQLASTWSIIELTEDQQAMLDQFPNLKRLCLMNSLIAPGWEESLNQVEELELCFGETYDIDFKKLTNVKKLKISSVKPYTLAIFLSLDEYHTLQNAGVEISFSSEQDREEYIKAASKIEEIVQSLDINENSTDQEKLDAILVYVLEKLEYDPEVSDAIRNGTVDHRLTEGFYENGKLYGALEKNTAICGNYAALVEALMDRISPPDQSTIVTSTNHAWNYVKVDGELYLVDATWLDGKTRYVQQTTTGTDEHGNMVMTISYEPQSAIEAILEGAGHELTWYMEDISEEHIASIDQYDSHRGTIPSYMLTEMEEASSVASPLEDSEEVVEETSNTESGSLIEPEEYIPDITNEKVKIKIGKKEIIISAGALVGIMTGLGTAIAIKKKKEKERLRRLRQQQSYRYSSYSSDPFGSSYGSSFGSSSYDDPFSSNYRPRR